MATKIAETVLEPGFVDKVRGRPALTEGEIIGRAIDFGNRGTFRSWCKLLEGVDVPELQSMTEPHSESRNAEQEALRRRALAVINPEREALRSALAAIVDKRVSPAASAEWCQLASGVLPVATYRMEGQRLRATYHYVVVEHFTGMNGLLACVLVWLLDPDRPFGQDLCRCQLEDCGNFFFTIRPDTGRPQKLYCREEHMRMAHQATAAERVRRSREKRKNQHTNKKRRQ